MLTGERLCAPAPAPPPTAGPQTSAAGLRRRHGLGVQFVDAADFPFHYSVLNNGVF